MENIKVVGFDADDTLWENQLYFDEIENRYCNLLTDYFPIEKVSEELLKVEKKNMKIYGFGVKSFTLSMIETALALSNNQISNKIINTILDLGKELLNKPVEILNDVEYVLKALSKTSYKLIIATKGDLFDQERKLKQSKLEKYFHHIEVMSNKKESNYQSLLSHLDISPKNFLMVGNSMKSDILPVINIGGYAMHIPHTSTWAHEVVENDKELNNFWELENLIDVMHILNPAFQDK